MVSQTEVQWLDDYFARYTAAAFDSKYYESLVSFKELIVETRSNGKKLIFAGNGASASIASHARVDFTKQCGCRSIDFNEPNLITAFSNDFGFENFMAEGVERFGDQEDVLVLISVSGESKNCVKAAERGKKRGLKVVTFTGKSPENTLRSLGDLNFWYDSAAYNIVECVHMLWICTVVDMVVGKAEYSVS
ncbi:SIS domain-containing protein [Ciceribacter sp. L1K22]|uniref:D-sedoheptulose-7-phosphate isomerase n=1 Tax=Ciceribacter sp. L1K22 TaxID=2820275 RepID=UPI001ABE45C6|nr:SIS domain-containing protein [Ciceribacter sp. L1K22]MBO3761561.1 SIS domain-containing protein [Ciceribacter sp. L1K22]